MMRQGEELHSMVDIDIREEDKKAVNRYAFFMYGLKVVLLIPYFFLIFFLIMNVPGNSLMWQKYGHSYRIVILAMLIIFILYYLNKKRFFKKIYGIMLSQCDPHHMISYCGALMKHVRREKSWGIQFYNIGAAFYYAGRIEDAKKVVWLMDKYQKTNRDLFLRRLLSGRINFYEKNQEYLQRDCEALTYLSKKVRMDKQTKFFFNVTLSQFKLFDLELQGRYEELYAMYESSYSYHHSMLADVMKNYYMYQAAKNMGNSELAESHRQMVLKCGGTLWYKAALENECR